MIDERKYCDEALAEAGIEPDVEGKETAEEQKQKQKQADILIREAERGAELFHSSDGLTWADITVRGGHRETWQIRSEGFRRWLIYIFVQAAGAAPASDLLHKVIATLDAKAAIDGVKREVYTRVAERDGIIYIDLCDSSWRAIEVSAGGGWRIISEPPVRFRRSRGMLPLPEPKLGGTIALLRRFVNFRKDNEGEADFVLLVSVLLAALRYHSVYPVVCLTGEHGSAKSTLSRIFRALVDPNTAPLRALPRENRDLFISATNSWAQVFDNVSGVADWLSDSLCRLATGGGFSTRQLYSDGSEILFNASRPQVLNGITDVVDRPDLADRTIFLTLQAIPEHKRRAESELLAEFEREAPMILGALLDVVSRGLKELPTTKLKRLPRMADFALWATACESALPWPRGTFAAAYEVNRRGAVAAVLDASPVATAVRAFMTEISGGALVRNRWQGIAKEFLPIITGIVGEQTARSQDWPKTPRHLRTLLQRAAAPLRQIGIVVTFDNSNHAKGRLILIQNDGAPRPPAEPSVPSASSVATKSPSETNDLGPDGVAGGAEGQPSAYDQPSVKPSLISSLKNNNNRAVADATDGTDDVAGHQGGCGNGHAPVADRLANGNGSPGQLCDHCGLAGRAVEPLAPYDWKGQQVLLHGRCEEPWFDSARARQ